MKMCPALETSGRNQNVTCCFTTAMLLDELRLGGNGVVSKYRLLGMTGRKGNGEGFVVSVKEHLVFRKLPYGMGQETD